MLALAKKNWRVLVRDFWTLVGRFLYPTLAIVCAIVLTQPQGTDAGTSVLPLDDATSLGAAPVLVGASATAAAEPQTAALLGSFAMAQALRSNATSVAKSAKPASLAGTIDQELLDAWPQRPNLYGAAFFESVPDAASAMSAPLAYSVLVNETGLHALPATLGVVHSAALRWLTGGTMRGIVPLTSPLPAIPTEVLEVLKSHGGASPRRDARGRRAKLCEVGRDRHGREVPRDGDGRGGSARAGGFGPNGLWGAPLHRDA